MTLTVSRFSLSYWVSQIPDRLDGDKRLIQIERYELDVQVEQGLPRSELRIMFGLLMYTYMSLAVPTGLVAAFFLGNEVRAVTVFTVWLSFVCIGEALYHCLRWWTTMTDEKIVVWHPLPADIAIIVAAFVFANSIVHH
jgi:ABC-type antimicrobial peptide transport system permease subunit